MTASNPFSLTSVVQCNLLLILSPLKNQYIYLEGYNKRRNIGYKFSIENFENGILKNKLRANYIQWNKETEDWTINKYEIRTFLEEGERLIEREGFFQAMFWLTWS